MKAFISYSHYDEHHLERLKVHLTPLRRDGKISDWTDKDIYAGSSLDKKISSELENSDLFISMISPDYLASNYCYEQEFQKALLMQEEGRLIIVPVILQPCEWHQTPFAKMKALPKDGKAISNWTNENNAYLDIATELRRLLKFDITNEINNESQPSNQVKSSRNYRIKKYFSEVDNFSYKEESFKFIKKYFKEGLEELDNIDNLQAKFIADEKETFTCLISNRSNNKNCFLTITLTDNQRSFFGDLRYDFSKAISPNSVQMDHIFLVGSDDYDLYWTYNGNRRMSDADRFNEEQVAEIIWEEFINQIGVSVD